MDNNSKDRKIIIGTIITVTCLFFILITSILIVVFREINNPLGLGVKDYQAGAYSEAEKLLDKAAAANPKNFTALDYSGKTKLKLKKYYGAVAAFQQAAKIKGTDVNLLSDLGQSYFKLEKYKESLNCYSKIISLKPTDSNAYSWRAYNYVLLEEYDKASEDCKKALSINPKDTLAYDVEGLAYHYNGKYEDALDCFDEAISADPNYQDAYVDKIITLYTEKDYSKCVEFSQDTLYKFPDNQEIYWYMADCYSRQDDHEKAIDELTQAVKIDSTNADILSSLGWEYYYSQDYDDASANANRALSLDPDCSDAQDLKNAVSDENRPEAEKIIDFVKNNYLYIDKVSDFDKKAEAFKAIQDPTPEDISKFIDSVKLKDDIFTFTITGKDYEALQQRDNITQVSSEELNPNTVYLRINSFTSKVDSDFKAIIDKISKPEETTLIIDLRNNTGGLAEPSNNILDMLLPECKTSYTIDRQGYTQSYYSGESYTKFKKIIVLVNEYTASSSELLTLGLKQYLNNVTVVGHPTFGKGVGQQTYENKAKGYSIFLVNFYWNVKEKNIAGSRITPDIIVKGSSDEAYIKVLKGLIN